MIHIYIVHIFLQIQGANALPAPPNDVPGDIDFFATGESKRNTRSQTIGWFDYFDGLHGAL